MYISFFFLGGNTLLCYILRKKKAFVFGSNQQPFFFDPTIPRMDEQAEIEHAIRLVQQQIEKEQREKASKLRHCPIPLEPPDVSGLGVITVHVRTPSGDTHSRRWLIRQHRVCELLAYARSLLKKDTESESVGLRCFYPKQDIACSDQTLEQAGLQDNWLYHICLS